MKNKTLPKLTVALALVASALFTLPAQASPCRTATPNADCAKVSCNSGDSLNRPDVSSYAVDSETNGNPDKAWWN
jgi:hypothetical protein